MTKFQKLNVTKAIKKIANPIMAQYDFLLLKGGKGQVWRFTKTAGEPNQEIWFQRSFSPNELFMSFKSINEPFIIPRPIYSQDKNLIDKGLPIPWKFVDQNSLENVVFQMVSKAEEFIIPFLNNDILNPQLNKEIYRMYLQNIERGEQILKKLSKLAQNDLSGK